MDKLEQLSRNISERISQENDYEWEMGEIHCTALNLMQENKDLSTETAYSVATKIVMSELDDCRERERDRTLVLLTGALIDYLDVMNSDMHYRR